MGMYISILRALKACLETLPTKCFIRDKTQTRGEGYVFHQQKYQPLIGRKSIAAERADAVESME